jgi:hypothetical protein
MAAAPAKCLHPETTPMASKSTLTQAAKVMPAMMLTSKILKLATLTDSLVMALALATVKTVGMVNSTCQALTFYRSLASVSRHHSPAGPRKLPTDLATIRSTHWARLRPVMTANKQLKTLNSHFSFQTSSQARRAPLLSRPEALIWLV